MRGSFKTFNAGTPDEVRALRGIDLTIEPGSFVVVIGDQRLGQEHGPERGGRDVPVDAGTIRLAGREITDWPEHRRARLIGRVFQDPLAGTSPSLSIAENLALAAGRGLSRGPRPGGPPAQLDEFRDRVRPLGMGLEDRLDNPIGSLSGGQRQALTLLMATYRRPSSSCSTSTPPRWTPAVPSRSSGSPSRSSAVDAPHHPDGHPLDGPRRLAGRPPDHGPSGPRDLRRLGRRETTFADPTTCSRNSRSSGDLTSSTSRGAPPARGLCLMLLAAADESTVRDTRRVKLV